MTTRFSHYGALIIWLGLIPLYVCFMSDYHLIGLVLLGGYIFHIFHRNDSLDLLTFKTLKRPNNDQNDRALFLTVAICFIAMLAYFASFGFNAKLFLSAYAILATIITFRAEALNEYNSGEL
jgi:small-conductance mechanosensitive channel